MCGLCGICGPAPGPEDAAAPRLEAMLEALAHRGPDDRGRQVEPGLVLGHNRLSILDLSAAGHQPMRGASGRYTLILNGEIYNYLELRRELGEHTWRSGSDTEVLLELWEKEGPSCLQRCRGMFALAMWDRHERALYLARDRFGVKPLYLTRRGAELLFASEIPALFAAGVPREPNLVTWATYLRYGLYDHGEATFWQGIERLPAGHLLRFEPDTGRSEQRRWYDPAHVAASGPDLRGEEEVREELLHRLTESIELRLRADVEIGVCLSGGFDSSLLLGLLRQRLGQDLSLRSYTFSCGDPAYDELPWALTMLAGTRVRWREVRLSANEVPALARRMMEHQAEPYGGLPTLAMAKVFEAAREDGVQVLLDGNGMDEAWAGYDYYARTLEGVPPAQLGPVQGSRSPAVRPEALSPDFAALAHLPEPRSPFPGALANAQLRDVEVAKIPRSLRFSDRVSMAASCELREPFLDHLLVELGLRQPPSRKIRDNQGKWLVRQVARDLLPEGLGEAPKKAVQTPQREWLRGPLAAWAEAEIDKALAARPELFEASQVRSLWNDFQAGKGDNSFPIWQWISAGMLLQ